MIQGYFLIIDISFQNNDQLSKLAISPKSAFFVFIVPYSNLDEYNCIYPVRDHSSLSHHEYIFWVFAGHLCLNCQPSRAGIIWTLCNLSQGRYPSHLVSVESREMCWFEKCVLFYQFQLHRRDSPNVKPFIDSCPVPLSQPCSPLGSPNTSTIIEIIPAS